VALRPCFYVYEKSVEFQVGLSPRERTKFKGNYRASFLLITAAVAITMATEMCHKVRPLVITPEHLLVACMKDTEKRNSNVPLFALS
jgi:hypothetical protein